MQTVQNSYQINSRVGNYVLKEEIGHGGIGTVYKATHKLLNHSAAVKVHEFFPESALVGISFLQSASYLSQLKHPNIVRLYDYGFHLGHAYMAMEYIEGPTLFELMPKSNLENWAERAEEWTQKAIKLFVQLLSAVRYAHNCLYLDLAGDIKRGILHGDIKPGNILIDRESDKIKLTDFMIPDVQAYLGKTKDSFGALPIDLNFGDLSANDETKSLTRRELAILSERFRVDEIIYRYGWSPNMSLSLQIAGLIVVTLGYILFGWAMVTNQYFSRVVRIQENRGHQVCTDGPYQLVRHPGYAGFIPAFLGMALAVGSWLALLPMAASAALLVLRTALEDRTLQEELPGYKAYATQVRYRLLPGVW